MHEEEADFSAVSALAGRRSFSQHEALRLYILLLGYLRIVSLSLVFGTCL